MRRQLIACDPGQLQTLCVPIQRGQGTLEAGTFINVDGQRALIDSGKAISLSWPERKSLELFAPLLSRIAGRFMGIGPRPEHIRPTSLSSSGIQKEN